MIQPKPATGTGDKGRDLVDAGVQPALIAHVHHKALRDVGRKPALHKALKKRALINHQI